ncbi:hypothetical protein TWF481_002124 [Arthrobotrys musiformis]|uniref:Uncharacterized protein n=1 Tax=Arthrobotrys musiformis TaxID=47236 RepID=A0AAV9VSA6_9PEZI
MASIITSKTLKSLGKLRYLFYTWALLTSFSAVVGQGEGDGDADNTFPSPGARRQNLPVGYGPHILASNHDWIKDEANLVLTALHEKQAKAGLYDVKEQEVQWSKFAGDLVIVTKRQWLNFEKDLGVGDPAKEHRDPLFNLMVLGKRATQMQTNIFRMFFLVRKMIPEIGIREGRDLYEVLDLAYSLYTLNLRNRFINNPKLQRRIQEVFKKDSPVLRAAASAVGASAQSSFDQLVSGARNVLTSGDQLQSYFDNPGILDPKGMLDSSRVTITEAGGYENITIKGERNVLHQLFSLDLVSSGGKDIFVDDGKFLGTWEVLLYAVGKLHLFGMTLQRLLTPRLAYYRETYGTLPNPVRSLEVQRPGVTEPRQLIGSERYIKEKYGGNLIELKSDDPKWAVWNNIADPKYFGGILNQLYSEVVAEAKAVLPAMLDCIADISIQLHASKVPESSRLGPVPEFGIPVNTRYSAGAGLNLQLLQQYPEFEPAEMRYKLRPVPQPEPLPQNPEGPSQPRGPPPAPEGSP